MTTTGPLRIGVLGAAAIAPTAIVKPARLVDRAEVTVVAARDRARATAFAEKWGIPRVLGGYDEVVADPDVDAVYIPLPNSHHAEWTTRALEAGKHVLCEKPLTANRPEAEAVAAVAAANPGVLMEAFHYRYHPCMRRAVEIVGSGELGPIRAVEAWMQIPLFKPGDIRFDPALAGGATMDLGCYSIHQLRHLTGEEPEVVAASAKQRPPGIDRWMRADLRFPSGATGRFTVSLYGAALLRIAVRVTGERGELRILNPTTPQLPQRFTVTVDGTRRRERFDKVATYTCQLEAFVAATLDGGEVLTGPDDSIATMAVIDDVYRAAGMQPRGSLSR